MKPIGLKFRFISYICAFIIAGVLTYLFAVSDITHETVKNNSQMATSSLPVVNVISDGGMYYNYMPGYMGKVNQISLRSVITPLKPDRKVSLMVTQYSCVVQGISYEVRDLTGAELIEQTKVTEYESRDGHIMLNLKLRNLIEEKQEYMLILKIETQGMKEISFYTRIVLMENPQVDEKLSYVKWFSNCTRSEEDINNIASRLDILRRADNTNLGFVNIHNSLEQVGYGKLKPTLASEMTPALYEIDGNLASIGLSYQLTAEDGGLPTRYQVWEYFRINRVDDTLTYVNTYDRYMNQLYDGSEGISQNGIIYFGISPTDQLERKNSPNGYVTAYVRNRNLWEYHAGKGNITKVFSFEDANSDNVRETLPDYDIKILNLTNEGDMDFAVYGRMNRGLHEGACGISIFHFSRALGQVTELAFLESDRSLTELKQDVNRLLYLNEKGHLYFYRNHTIYYVDCNTRECMLVTSDVNPESCLTKGRLLMYQTGLNLHQSENVYVLDCEEGNTRTIDADAGMYLRALGYIDDKIILGVTNQGMEGVDLDGVEHSPMKEILLMDEELSVIKRYANAGYFVTDVKITDTKVELSRVRYDEDTGLLVPAGGDELFSNEAQPKNQLVYEGVLGEDYELRYQLVPIMGTYMKEPVKYVNYVFPEEPAVFVSNTTESYDTYYRVWGEGGILVATPHNLAVATDMAYNAGGVVCDETGEMIWCRYKKTRYSITIPDNAICLANEEISSAQAAINTMLAMAGYETRLNETSMREESYAKEIERLTGCCYELLGNTLELSFYFTNEDIPLVVRRADGSYQLVVAYTDQDVTTMNLYDGNTQTMSLEDMNKDLASRGSVILTVPKAR